MAYDDLKEISLEELGKVIELLKGSLTNVGDPTGRGAAARQELADRGYWYCDHDEAIQPLPFCLICTRHYDYLTNPQDDE